MAGFVIHLAAGLEHSKKYNIEDKEEFLKGNIAPDLTGDKRSSHYGAYSSQPDLGRFISEKGINSSNNRGEFLHLITDYLFYNKYLSIFSKEIYEDYSFLNGELIEEYGIDIPDEIKDMISVKEGTPKILDIETLKNFIAVVKDIDLDQVANGEIDLSKIEIIKSKSNIEASQGGKLVYHGSIITIEKPDPNRIRRNQDFGKGFYVTLSKEQAEQWARTSATMERVINGNSQATPTINIYEFNADGLNVLSFDGYTEEWLDFVAKSRTEEPNAQKTYDAIYGNVANGDVVNNYLGLLKQNKVNEDVKGALLQRLQSLKTSSQYCCLTAKAMESLRYIGKYITDYRDSTVNLKTLKNPLEAIDNLGEENENLKDLLSTCFNRKVPLVSYNIGHEEEGGITTIVFQYDEKLDALLNNLYNDKNIRIQIDNIFDDVNTRFNSNSFKVSFSCDMQHRESMFEILNNLILQKEKCKLDKNLITSFDILKVLRKYSMLVALSRNNGNFIYKYARRNSQKIEGIETSAFVNRVKAWPAIGDNDAMVTLVVPDSENDNVLKMISDTIKAENPIESAEIIKNEEETRQQMKKDNTQTQRTNLKKFGRDSIKKLAETRGIRAIIGVKDKIFKDKKGIKENTRGEL